MQLTQFKVPWLGLQVMFLNLLGSAVLAGSLYKKKVTAYTAKNIHRNFYNFLTCYCARYTLALFHTII